MAPQRTEGLYRFHLTAGHKSSHIKGYPFEIVLENHSINGCILSDQIKNLDYRQRNCDFIEKATEEEIDSVVDNIKLLIE